jgi:hypothetical protein
MHRATSVSRAFFLGIVVLGTTLGFAQTEVLEGPTLTMDPTGWTPLAGAVEIRTADPVRVVLEISDGIETRRVRFPDQAREHFLPVIGLEPDRAYRIDVILIGETGRRTRLNQTLLAVTGPLPDDFPTLTTRTLEPFEMEPGFTLLDRFSRRPNDTRPAYAIIVDQNGDVVWYSSRPRAAIVQLPNGNLLYRDGNFANEMDMLGNLVSSVELSGVNRLHHDLFPTGYGTLLSLDMATVVVEGYPTSETDPDAPAQTAEVRDEPVVEFAADGTLLNRWPLTDVIDPTRIGYDSLREANFGLDWAHSNAVIHDPRDDSIIVSIRHQDSVIKFSRQTGELIWILGPHDNWTAEHQPYLLQPVGAPFEWQFHQHAPMITPSGTLLLFDNGNHRASPFDGRPQASADGSYSRAVEYVIDEVNMEVREVWEYGANAADRIYTQSRGDADWMSTTGNVLITFSAINFVNGVLGSDLGLGSEHARIVEVDHGTPASVVFDLQVHDPTGGSIRIYRSERIRRLYPPDHVTWQVPARRHVPARPMRVLPFP